ncbi:MAG: bifunctional chorismate mutase/prephenate dehydratase [Lentisphaerae bacterium]|nr:bifunctional chorismate mutase/prephenate dehydratase [Lentisphaerota bacterium]
MSAQGFYRIRNIIKNQMKRNRKMDISNARKEIDQIDEKILELFSRRMELGKQIGKLKEIQGLPVENPLREREILLKMTRESGVELQSSAGILFSTLFELSKAYQRRSTPEASAFAGRIRESLENTPALFPATAKVGCCGIPGAYAQLAADRLFKLADIISFNDFSGVFQAVEKGLCRYGVLPIENSTSGTIDQVCDLMRDHKFYIVRSCRLQVKHALLLAPGAKISDVKEVISHEQGLKQCANFIRQLGNVKMSTAGSTAMAARIVSESGRKDLAAIASSECAAIYSLAIGAANIQDRDSNYTRFICISREPEIYPGASRISIMGTLPHKPGSLYRLLARFAVLGVNLTKLESRPGRDGNFEYMFYFDFEASLHEPGVFTLLTELAADGGNFTFLGNYQEI